MKLNKEQKYALLMFLGHKLPELATDYSVISQYDQFCNEEISEWRVIYCFGMTGKIWNGIDTIYITGYSHREIGKREYAKQQKTIDAWNKDIALLLNLYY